MTCGACYPEAFQPKKGKRVWGYLTASDMHAATAQARKLYFLGAHCVLSDMPQSPLKDRPGWRVLDSPVILRDGDRLILSKSHDLDNDQYAAQVHIDALTARGVEVCTLNPEYFEADEP